MQQDIVELVGSAQELKEKRVVIKEKDDTVFLIMNNKANSMSPSFMREIHAGLSLIENKQKEEQKYKSLVVTSTSQKIFSAGLDLKYIQKADNQDQVSLLMEFQRLIARLCTYGMVTIAMVNGHCIGGGVMLAMACDYRVMKQGKEVMCLNEVQMGVPIPPGMFSVLKSKIGVSHLRTMVLTAQKLDCQMAKQAGLIDQVVPEQNIMQKCLEMSQQQGVYGYNFDNLVNIKEELYKEVLVQCLNNGLSTGVKVFYDRSLFPKL